MNPGWPRIGLPQQLRPSFTKRENFPIKSVPLKLEKEGISVNPVWVGCLSNHKELLPETNALAVPKVWKYRRKE